MKKILASCMTAACLSGFSVNAQPVASSPDTAPCPEAFNAVPVFPHARLCQSFGDSLPATMVYHAQASVASTIQYYVDNLGNPQKQQTVAGRTMLQYQSGAIIVVVSADGSGSQVDLLVNPAS